MAPLCGILRLSNELLRDILDHIEEDPDKLVSVDRRAYLSQESFRQPPEHPPNQAQDVANFRRTCRRFAEIGVVHQFARVTTRFSRRGFERLENIAGQGHLAKHVKKFSYMVPNFYVEGRERVRELVPNIPCSIGSLDARHFVRKITEQKEIVASQEDVRVLKKALAAFTSLQHVQILRVLDQEDCILLSYIRQNQGTSQFVDFNWAPACSHSTKTIVTAILASSSPCSRFSSPMLTPSSAVSLIEPSPSSLMTLAERLTCLELHFDDGVDLNSKMRDLSETFRHVFQYAKNMQAVHVGFPSHRPVSLRLEEIFHNVRWEKLVAFGIQAWRLDGHEIINLARRHRERLKGLRLRDVLLKDGSMWKDVLAYLRDDMYRLDWVSLRRIGYEAKFDEDFAMGAEVPDDPPGDPSDSDDESESYTWDPLDPSDHAGNGTTVEEGEPSTSATSYDADEYDSDFETSTWHSLDALENGAAGDAGMGFPPLSPDTPSSVPWCNCNGRSGYPSSAEELGDDGVFVSNAKRKMWERWVVNRCAQHVTR